MESNLLNPDASRSASNAWWRSRPWSASVAGAVLACSLAGPASADSVPLPADSPSAYRTECGACHIAYAPGLLPAASWRRLMAGLSNHYGGDASLDAAVSAELSAWLQANAASARKVRRDPTPPAEDRITRSTWFVREHRELGADVWRRSAVGSASNCAACHPSAAQGRFSERDLRVPR